MKKSRIYFIGNPWPEGHPIKEFRWTAEIKENKVWFHFHLETENYYSERKIEDDEDVEYASDWEAPSAWGNFHSCKISSTFWHDGGFPVCPVENYGLSYLDGLEISLESPPDFENNCEDKCAFHTYLLGHDFVSDHSIKFKRKTNSNHFDIFWSGKIALAYVGEDEFKYHFKSEIFDVEAPEIVRNS